MGLQVVLGFYDEKEKKRYYAGDNYSSSDKKKIKALIDDGLLNETNEVEVNGDIGKRENVTEDKPE